MQAGGWGLNPHNTRFQPNTNIDASNVAGLELRWAYGLSTSSPRSWPLVTEDTLFIGDAGRGLVALDRETGCTRWVLEHDGAIGTAIVHGRIEDRDVLVFGDRTAGIHAVDARTGTVIWRTALTETPVPLYSGTPLVHEDAVFVPVSSQEIGLPVNPFYGCCTTSGAVARLDLRTGAVRWYRRTIDEPPRETGRHWLLVEEHGPSGAPVWGSPALDPARQLVYVGTGQNYSRPATETSDAILAVDADTGEVRWVRQFTADDAFNMACAVPGHPNCPDPMGPDLDFGAPPMLVRVNGTELVIAGQKSGDVYAMDPDTGKVRWQRNVGRGGALGGVHWGMAAHEPRGLVLVPVSDVDTLPRDGTPQPGLHALDAATGELHWTRARTPRCPERVCAPGLSAAITATPELVFAGSLDGYLEAYRVRDGALLWSHDAWREYETVNGVPATGGAFDAHGPLVVDDLVIVSSGYRTFGERGGNALLVFELPGAAAPAL